MNKKKLWILLSALLAVVLVAGAVLAYSFWPESIDKATSRYEKEFSFTTHPQSPEIVVDGVLNEDVWQGKNWWKHTYLSNVNGVMPKVELTAFPNEYGIYIASVVYDSNLTSDGERAPGTNSNWELYVAACDAGADLFSDAYRGKWSMQRFYVDMYGGGFSYFNDFDRAVVVEGELNSGETTSATLEMFIPWTLMKVDTSKGIPESIGIMPCYRGVLETGGSTSWLSPADSDIATSLSVYMFDKTGYYNADAKDAVVGDSFHGYAKTKGWDLSQIDQGIIRSPRGGWEKIFFTDAYADNFIVETTIVPVQGRYDDYPKAGISFLRTDGQHHTVWLDGHGVNGLVDSVNGTKNFPDYQIVTLNQTGGWNQKSLSGYNKSNPNATTQEGVRLTVVKYGNQFWYFADGKFLTTEQVSFMDGDCIPGFWSLGMDVYYKDYSCRELDEQRLSEYLNERQQYLIAAKAKGGGTVSVDKRSVSAGQSYVLSITCKDGYRVACVECNGQDITAGVRSGASGGQYAVANVQENQNIVVTFEKCEEITYSGFVMVGEQAQSGIMILEGLDDHSAYYELDFSKKKGFEAQLPAGKYYVTVLPEGCKTVEKTVDLSVSLEDTIQAELSQFVESTKVNSKNANSSLENFDLSQEHKGKIYASTELKSAGKALYFDGSGTDFVAQVTMNYTTTFVENETYQPDLIGGFTFSDGTTEQHIWACQAGIIYNGWKRVNNIFGKSVLLYPEPKSAVFTVAKQGENIYIYLDGRKVYSASWNELVPNIAADGEVAVGLSMWADYRAEMEFGNYSVSFDSEYVSDFVNSH